MTNTMTAIRNAGVITMGCLGLLAGAGTCRAEDGQAAQGPSPAMVEQLNLANKLIALGEARKDPLLLIAAAKLQKGLGAETAGLPDQAMATKAVLDSARKYAAGRKDLVGLADDVAAQKSKDCTYCTSADKKYFGKY